MKRLHNFSEEGAVFDYNLGGVFFDYNYMVEHLVKIEVKFIVNFLFHLRPCLIVNKIQRAWRKLRTGDCIFVLSNAHNIA